MDALIERALRHEATRAELAVLAAWRAALPEHDARYRRLARLLAGAAALRGELRGAAAPTAAELFHPVRRRHPGR